MSNLIAIINNAIIGEAKVWDKPKTKIAIWTKDKNIREIEGIGSSCYGLENGIPLAEVDVLYVKEKENGIKIYSFEIKSHKINMTRQLKRQLLKQSIFLLLTTLEGFCIYSDNICMSLDDRLMKKPLEIRVMYVGGYKESELKEKPLVSLFQSLYKNGRAFSDIYVFRRSNEFYIRYAFALNQSIPSGEFTIQADSINLYRQIIVENYKDILDDILNSNREADLQSILIRYGKINGLNFEALSRI